MRGLRQKVLGMYREGHDTCGIFKEVEGESRKEEENENLSGEEEKKGN